MSTMTNYDLHSRPTADELRTLPVLGVGQADNLHYDSGEGLRIWLSRTGVADGEPYDSTVTIETYDSETGSWAEAVVYDGDNPPHNLIRGYFDLPMRNDGFTYDERAKSYAYTLPENALEFPSWAAMRVAVNNSGSHYFDRAAVEHFLAQSDKRLFGRRFWVESRQLEDSAGKRDPREFFVAWVSDYNGHLSVEKWGNLSDLPAARGWCQRFAEAVTQA